MLLLVVVSLGRARVASVSKAMPRRAVAWLGLATPRLALKGRVRAMLEYGEKPGRRRGQEESFITTAAGISFVLG
jgi:hypothetical protein